MSEFVAYLDEVFQSFGAIDTRRMFGGYGIYHEELMFALVADDMLYLKVDDQNVREFLDKDLGPFEYMKKGKPTALSYY